MSDGDRVRRAENRNIAQIEAALIDLQQELEDRVGKVADCLLEQGSDIDRLTRDMTDGQRTRGANVPLTPFYGNRTEDFSQYIKQFELICDANNYAADKRAQILASYLRDKSFYIYDSLTDAQKGDYTQLKAALSEKFQTTDYRRYAHQKFQERKQLPSETVVDYGCDVHRLGLAALATINADQRDTLIREKFIAGLLPQLRELIVYSSPKSFNEAMTLAERLEGLHAGKQDSSAKSVMLLEDISDRLAKLEVNRIGAMSNDGSPMSLCAVEEPMWRTNAQVARTGGFNLCNSRPDFRNGDTICYRCNRSGHIARNCPRNRDMNTVVCRACNRMGHFARNCQRRGTNTSWQPSRPNFNRRPHIPIGRYGFPPRIQPANRTLAVTTPAKTVSAHTADARRWESIVGVIQCAKSEKFRVRDKTTPPQCKPGIEVAEFSMVKNNRYRVNPTKFSLIALLATLLLMISYRGVTAEWYAAIKTSAPMICQAYEGKVLWKLPKSFDCPKGDHTTKKQVIPEQMMLYKRNYVQYKTRAWKCVRVTQEVKTFSYFFGDENLTKEMKHAETVSTEDCTRMKLYKTCRNEPMIYSGGIYRTDRKLDWHYPGGGVNCCYWKKFTATNCYMYETFVYKRHDNPIMESTAGDVSECVYQKGQCILADGALLLWEVSNKSMCSFLPWRTVEGKRFGTSWLSDDSNLALTFTRKQQTSDCKGHSLLMSDQGIPVRSNTRDPKVRKARQLSGSQIRLLDKALTTKGGIVSSAQLAASLQALELRWEQNMEFAFSHALNSVCNFMRSVIELLKTQIVAYPTMAIRSLTNQSEVFAKSGGNVIEVFPCRKLRRTQYRFKPMNKTCTAQLPIKFKINNKTHLGYLDPMTNIIHRFSMPIDCHMMKEVPIQIEGKTYLYSSKTGYITRNEQIPTLKVFQWNIEPMIDMKSTIFHEIVIYNWEELQTHINLNDILGGLDRQRAVLRQMGINAEEEEPQKSAERAVSRIMSLGYFGFLHGLTANLFQVWTFVVCLYVTFCVIVIHCLPLNAIPVGLNLGNAVKHLKTKWTNWQYDIIWNQENVDPTAMELLPMSNARGIKPQPLVKSPSLESIEKRVYAMRERLGRRPLLQLLPSPRPSEAEPTAPGSTEIQQNSRKRPRTEDVFQTLEDSDVDVRPFRVNGVNISERTPLLLYFERKTDGDTFVGRLRSKVQKLVFCVRNCLRKIGKHGVEPEHSNDDDDDTLDASTLYELMYRRPNDVPYDRTMMYRRPPRWSTRSRHLTATEDIHQEHEVNSFIGTSEMIIYAFVEGMRVRALIDTGSSLTLIPSNIARLLRSEINKESITAVSMTGHELCVIGEVLTIVRVGNQDVRGKLVVVRDSPYELIVGTDLMKHFGTIKLDFERRAVQFGNERISLANDHGIAGVFLCQPIRIPPRTEALAMGVCYGLTPEEVITSPDSRFEPSWKLLAKYDVMSQEAIVRPMERLIPVRLMNTDAVSKYLPEKATLGYLQPLDAYEVNSLELANEMPGSESGSNRARTDSELDQLCSQVTTDECLTERQRSDIRNLIMGYETLFAKNEYDLGETTLIEHEIDTGDAKAISQRPYRTPHSLRAYLSKKIEEMLQHGIIQPSNSDWSSAVVLVNKKDTTDLRFCVDNRKLNDVTIKDSYPLKRIDDAFDMLCGAKYFATLDLQSGYWQIPIKKSDQKKTAFVTGDGLFEYTKMNFGLCNAPATFQRLMDQVLRGLDFKICMSYIDDIIIPGKDIPQLTQRLQSVFERLMAAGLKLKLRKCKFGMQELKFLGFVVSQEGLKADPEKIQKITGVEEPKNRDELRSFLGFTGWCKRFVKGYAQVAAPLTELLKQTKSFKWTADAQTAFDTLKERYTSTPILAYPDMTKTFIICTDASNRAIGAVLCQKDENGQEHPISYDSRILSPTEGRYSTIEKEMLAIFWAVVKKYRVYVFGRDFEVFTDHKPLLGVWKSPPAEGRLGRWCVRMTEYRPYLTLQYREGKANVVADYLSRLVPELAPNHNKVMVTEVGNPKDICEEQKADNYFGAMITYLECAALPQDRGTARKILRWASEYELIDGTLHRSSSKYPKWLVVLPQPLRRKVLIANHDSLLGGHLGIRKTLTKIEKKHFWPGYYRDVVNWCRGCMACQTRKPPPKRVKAPMNPVPVSAINQKWALDICGPLPLSENGNRYILVCMEYFSKWPELFAVPDTKTEQLAKLFVEKIVLRYGCPDVLISDQGLNVHSALIKEICNMLDIDKLRTSPYHPQSDGMVERFNRILQHMISMYVNRGHNDWCELLPYLSFAYRSSVHETTKESPFFLMYGLDPRMPIDTSILPSNMLNVSTDDDFKLFVLASLLESRRLVADNIVMAQGKQKTYYDKNSAQDTFLEGDRVLVHCPAIAKGKSRKFARNWKGPYRILEVSRNGANILVRAMGSKRTIWIHVNRAKLIQPEVGLWHTSSEEDGLAGIETPLMPADLDEDSTGSEDAAPVTREATRPADLAAQNADHTGSDELPNQGSSMQSQNLAGTDEISRHYDNTLGPDVFTNVQASPTVCLKSTLGKQTELCAEKENCAKCGKRGKPGRWIACDKCDQWYHFSCVGLKKDPLEEFWLCSECLDNPEKESKVRSSEGDSDSDSSISTIDDEASDTDEAQRQSFHHLSGQDQAPAPLHSNYTATHICGMISTKALQRQWIRPGQTVEPAPTNALNSFVENCLCKTETDKKPHTDGSPYEQRIPFNTAFPVQFTVGEQIGKGGFGRVYSGNRVCDAMPVAVKQIPYRYISRWEILQQQTVPLELKLLYECQEVHGVIKVLGWGKWPDSFYIVMERPSFDGDLYDYITQNKYVTEGIARLFFQQIVNIVLGCLKQGIVHRDLKDENFLVDVIRGRLILIDFGVAGLVAEEPFQENCGTRQYWPPEWFVERQYRGEPTSVWSLGIILHTLVCGDIPYYTDEQILKNRLKLPLRLSKECRDLIRWCLASEPSRRPTLSSLLDHIWFRGAETTIKKKTISYHLMPNLTYIGTEVTEFNYAPALPALPPQPDLRVQQWVNEGLSQINHQIDIMEPMETEDQTKRKIMTGGTEGKERSEELGRKVTTASTESLRIGTISHINNQQKEDIPEANLGGKGMEYPLQLGNGDNRSCTPYATDDLTVL